MLMVIALPYENNRNVGCKDTGNRDESNLHQKTKQKKVNGEDFIDIKCSYCGETFSVMVGETNIPCPWCKKEIIIKN